MEVLVLKRWRLAKQAWRIWSRPNSLVSRILQGRYFPRSSFLEANVGTRPSYAWRSILHGRELLAQGLLKKIGNGESVKVWTDNWIIDEVPRPPHYHPDAEVDLTLTVRDLIDDQSSAWNIPMVRQLFCEEDVSRVLNVKVNVDSVDTLEWGFSKNGVYNTKSGYKLAVVLQEKQVFPPSPALPPLERKLWRDLWKSKTTPKIKHFMWRALSGALAVKQGLKSRGITLDTTCLRCGSAEESICHVLFHCEVAKEAWERSQIPLPPGGFSRSSVWLNFFHLLSVSKRHSSEGSIRLSFPWVLWHIWKARNIFCYEKIHLDGATVLSRAMEEASTWFNLQLLPSESSHLSSLTRWQKPPVGTLKCNIASSWPDSSHNHGSSWIVRDSTGLPLFHSRRAFAPVFTEIEAGLATFEWSLKAAHDLKVKKISLEISSPILWEALSIPDRFPNLGFEISKSLRLMHDFDQCQLSLVPSVVNIIAEDIAVSVTRDHRYQSYIATGGPSWLSSMINLQAAG